MAFRTALALALLVSLGFAAHAPSPGGKTKISVYFESLSPESRAFFTEQLYPTWLKHRANIKLDLYVYGRSMETVTEDGYTYACEYGLKGCQSNVMMMCAKMNIPTVEQLMSFFNCVMDDFSGVDATAKCALESNVDYNRISQCSTSAEGMQIFHNTAVKQSTVAPNLSSVPWILVDDRFAEEAMIAARQDLLALICSVNPAMPKDACLNDY